MHSSMGSTRTKVEMAQAMRYTVILNLVLPEPRSQSNSKKLTMKLTGNLGGFIVPCLRDNGTSIDKISCVGTTKINLKSGPGNDELVEA